MKSVPVISSERLVLRLATQEDVPEIIKFFHENQAHLAPWEPIWTANFFTQEFWQEEVEKNIQAFKQDQSLKLFLFKKTNPNKVIGRVNFNNFVRGTAQFCYLGYSLAETEQGKGYMFEALQTATNYVFAELNMHRIQANYIPHNQRSGNLLKRLRFVIEGYARDYLLINGKWQDHILTSLTNKNWRQG